MVAFRFETFKRASALVVTALAEIERPRAFVLRDTNRQAALRTYCSGGDALADAETTANNKGAGSVAEAENVDGTNSFRTDGNGRKRRRQSCEALVDASPQPVRLVNFSGYRTHRSNGLGNRCKGQKRQSCRRPDRVTAWNLPRNVDDKALAAAFKTAGERQWTPSQRPE
jgi:hypothetical protein